MLALSFPMASAGARELSVVVTSKPIHALVAEVMQGVGTPALLVEGSASPHTYAMRPSDARKVARADVFFRVSEALEPFTARVVKSLPHSVEVVTLAEAPGLKLLKRRAGGAFERRRHGTKGHGHDHGHASARSDAIDGHVWLDPSNAKLIAAAAARALSARRPDAAARIEANVAALSRRLDELAVRLERDLAPLSGRPFLVLHDAYQYFESRFGLNAIGSILIDPDEQPSARRISDLRRKVSSLSAVCVFAEANHQPRVIATVTEGTRARTAVLDPEGTMLEPGPGLYFELMQRLSSGMRSCLQAP